MVAWKKKHIDTLLRRYPELEPIKESICEAAGVLAECYENKGKLLIAGNGGSAADSEHIVGELMKSFVLDRRVEPDFASALCSVDATSGEVLSKHLQRALPAIALDGHLALTTAYMNDCEPLLCFAQQLYGYGKAGDVFLGISTSGNSKNILYAAVTARAKGMKVIGLTGKTGGEMKEKCDITIVVPWNKYSDRIQEIHIKIIHILIEYIEQALFNTNK